MYQSRFFECLKNSRETVVDRQDEAVVYDNAVGNVGVVFLNFQVEHCRQARHPFNGLDQVGSVANVHRLSTQGDRPWGCSGILWNVLRFETVCLTEPDRELE